MRVFRIEWEMPNVWRSMCLLMEFDTRHAVMNAWEAVSPGVTLAYSDVRFSAQDCAVNSGIVFG